MPRSKYPEETKEKIIDAGLRTFQEKGYEQSTILDIVANMDGLTRGAFYHHFKSKEEVLSAICEKIFYSNNPFEQVRSDTNLNGMEKLRKAIMINMAAQRTDFAVLESVSMEMYKSPQFFMWQMEFNVSLCKKYVQPLIEEGMADGSIKEQDPQILAELFIVMFSFWVGCSLFLGDATYMEKKATAAIEVLENFGLPIYNDEFEEVGQTWLDDAVQAIEDYKGENHGKNN